MKNWTLTGKESFIFTKFSEKPNQKYLGKKRFFFKKGDFFKRNFKPLNNSQKTVYFN